MSKLKQLWLPGAILAAQALIIAIGTQAPPADPLWISAQALVALVLVGGVMLLLLNRVARPLADLRATIGAIRQDGDLSRRAPIRDGEAGATAQAFNDLLASIQSIMGKVYFNSGQVASASEQLHGLARQVSASSRDQQAGAQRAAQSFEQMLAGVQAVAAQARQAAASARYSGELSVEGSAIAHRASAELARITQAVEESATAITKLGEASASIQGIVKTIREIADQTNLLALNAAIEAARAGEQGRGFAVVADEVRKLAERTSQATTEIGAVINTINTDTARAVELVRSGTDLAREGAQHTEDAAQALDAITRSARETMDQVHAIAQEIEVQSREGDTIVHQVSAILQLAQGNSEGAAQVLGQSTQLDHLAINLKDIGNVFKLGEIGTEALRMHGTMPEVVQRAAEEVARVLEQAIASKRISEADLFDTQHQPIPNTRPQKYHTRFDRLTDELLPAIQEPILNLNANLIYAGAVDRKGYFPTHNKRFSQALTGNAQIDTINNRTKRIFDDPVGRRCGSHELPFLIQTYRRDTGEIVHDISAPIHVLGRHWGGFRIGYQA